MLKICFRLSIWKKQKIKYVQIAKKNYKKTKKIIINNNLVFFWAKNIFCHKDFQHYPAYEKESAINGHTNFMY